jgi:hypothetical protein
MFRITGYFCKKKDGDALDIWERDMYPAEEVFPDSHQGKILRGREGLTQRQLAEKSRLKRHHISEMALGKRPIGKEMARRLAVILNTSYKMLH